MPNGEALPAKINDKGGKCPNYGEHAPKLHSTMWHDATYQNHQNNNNGAGLHGVGCWVLLLWPINCQARCRTKQLIMKSLKLGTLAIALTFTIGFTACNEEKNDDKLIEVNERDRIIERDRDKTEIDIEAKDGKVGVGVENDKKKVDVEIGKDDKN